MSFTLFVKQIKIHFEDGSSRQLTQNEIRFLTIVDQAYKNKCDIRIERVGSTEIMTLTKNNNEQLKNDRLI